MKLFKTRFTCAFLLSALLMAGVTACGDKQTMEEMQEEAQFSKVCKESGGQVWYNGYGQIGCDFREAK